jgi:hypothetical protein
MLVFAPPAGGVRRMPGFGSEADGFRPEAGSRAGVRTGAAAPARPGGFAEVSRKVPAGRPRRGRVPRRSLRRERCPPAVPDAGRNGPGRRTRAAGDGNALL